jgi:hypothetical protein
MQVGRNRGPNLIFCSIFIPTASVLYLSHHVSSFCSWSLPRAERFARHIPGNRPHSSSIARGESSMRLLSGERFSAATLVLACCVGTGLRAQVVMRPTPPATEKQVITLDPQPEAERQAQNVDGKGHPLAPAPANFRRLGEATMGQAAEVHTLTLRFTAEATLTGISTTADFPIQGGSCAKGNTYQHGTTCTVLVRFTPQGPGNRLGTLTVRNSASATPFSMGLGGYGYAPALSFIPSVITTVPGTYPSGAGMLNSAQNLATDGGDRLFIADTGNAKLWMIDSSGTIDKYSGSYILPPPLGITVDNLGQVWFTATTNSQMYAMPNPTLAETWGFAYTDTCSYATAPCNLSGETLYNPRELSADNNNNIFFSEKSLGAAMSNTQPIPTLLRLFSAQAYFSQRFATDQYDDLYSFNLNYCEIMEQTLNDAERQSPSIYRVVAGSGVCGFSGDGGDARNAQLSATLGQFAFDAAGNLYFTDGANQRVRRIDYNTGIIRTIAGTGVSGYLGDGVPATSAQLASPTGLAVDSQGQVYIISGDGGGGTKQVVRKVTTLGDLSFGNQTRNTSSSPRIVTVSNTGNSNMVLNNFAIAGANPGDFAIDPITTSCNLTAGATMNSGATCTIGVIFTPSATGVRAAKLIFSNNTVTNSNTVLLNGAGTLPPATLSITSPTPGQSFAAGTAITLAAKVVGGSFGIPTGTIQFQADGANFGSPVALNSGVASTSVTGLTTILPSHLLGAIYSGDTNYGAAGPVTVSITITAAAIVSRVSLAPVMAPKNAAVIGFAVSVSSDDGTTPAGQVELRDGNTPVAFGALTNGHVVLKLPTLAAGVHSLTAAYAGDGRHSPAVSPVMLEVVTPGGQCSPSGPVPLSQR